jgi:hypothetical protein
VGLKLPVVDSDCSPSLYVRTVVPKADGFAFLGTLPFVAAHLDHLTRELRASDTLYGLGFFARDGVPGLKTYTVGDVDARQVHDGVLPGTTLRAKQDGFVSHRLYAGDLSSETKLYLEHVTLDDVARRSARAAEVVAAASKLRVQMANHIGVTFRPPAEPEFKLYFERRGGIPNDFAKR